MKELFMEAVEKSGYGKRVKLVDVRDLKTVSIMIVSGIFGEDALIITDKIKELAGIKTAVSMESGKAYIRMGEGA